jgi:cell division protease FtsH
MAFVPGEHTTPQLSAVWRTIFFGVFMLVLDTLLWEMASWQVGDELNYSDFMQQVDKNNVASAELLMGQRTSRVRGTLREPAKRYSAAVPTEAIPDLTDRLKKQGVSLTVSKRKIQLPGAILNYAPLILLIVFWIFAMNRIRGRQQVKL